MALRGQRGQMAIGPATDGAHMPDTGAVLSVRDLAVEYRTSVGPARAVRGVDLDIFPGEAVGLIGESGSGKSTIGLALLRLLVRTARVSHGTAHFRQHDGTVVDVLTLGDAEMRRFRWQEMAMVFQSALNALNPVLRVSDHFRDTARAHGKRDNGWTRARAEELLRMVQLDPERVLPSFPHELSGGMRQRVSIALALLLEPQMVILDEPTTALDILTQRAIIDVVRALRERLQFTMLFISHDLSLASELADRVATMYAGKIVEIGPVREVFHSPRHPYTVGLMNAVPPIAGEEFVELTAIPGAPPSLTAVPPGCAFHPRCPYATAQCRTDVPPLIEVGPNHQSACWHHDEVDRARAFKESAPNG
ncbi:MAG: ABC transporter ATP-binding protein [Chloroflexota bacterium]|nr:ABC transporter ATP-binding protein [Chloroflexota bacterium]